MGLGRNIGNLLVAQIALSVPSILQQRSLDLLSPQNCTKSSIVAALKPTRGIGVITLFLSAASTISLFSYIFISGIRDTAMFFALGILCGLLVHIMFNPDTVPEIFS